MSQAFFACLSKFNQSVSSLAPPLPIVAVLLVDGIKMRNDNSQSESEYLLRFSECLHQFFCLNYNEINLKNIILPVYFNITT